MKKSSYVLVILLAVFGIVVFLSGCDCDDRAEDDSNGSGLHDGDGTLADVDQTTAENALAMLMMKGLDDIPIDTIIDDFTDQSSGMKSKTTVILRDWALGQVKEALLSGTVINRKNELLAGSISESGSCDSGSFKAEGSWTGPDKPNLFQLCGISDIEMTMTLDNCKEFCITANGEAKISVAGSLCSPQSLSVDFTDFSIKESISDTQIEFNEFSMASSVVLPEGLKNLVHIASVMNGDVTINNVSTEYKDYKEDATFSRDGVTISAMGFIKGSCVDGWINVETVSPVTINFGDCPSGGNIKLSGNGDMTATFNDNSSISIGETSFSSCDDLPEACQSDNNAME